MRRDVLVVLGALAAPVAIGQGCNNAQTDCLDLGNCVGLTDGAAADSVVDGGADVVAPPPGCDPLAEPKDAPRCVVDAFGVFVSKGGVAGAAGTKAAPLGSIQAAVALATQKGLPRVYVCGADAFDEAVAVGGQVSIYGGFACADWAPAGGTRPKIAPTRAGEIALTLSGAPGDGIVVSDVDVKAPDGDTQGARSSVGVFVRTLGGKGATLRRMAIEAGLGRAGDDGAEGATMTFTAAPGPGKNGITATDNAGAPAQVCTCSDGKTTTGGKGSNTNGAAGDPGLPALGGGMGGSTPACSANDVGNGSGKVGTAATDALPAPGATKLGALDASGWRPEDGLPGAAGGHGQGGGGGGGYTIAGGEGGGGSGGCGGCGGTGGGAGKGGGASVAILVLESPSLTLTQVALTTKDAGKGGDGKKGGDGDTGGSKGNGFASGCQAGNGGKGANGGAGGGGAGGVSAGVLHKGPKPSGDYTWTGPSAKAARGESPGNPGVAGESAKEVAAP